MNDREAACFGAEALEYLCSVCDFVRLAVRPVNSDFDIFIRILFYCIARNFRQRKISSKATVLAVRQEFIFVKRRSSRVAFWSFGRRSVAYRLSSHS